MSDSVGPHRRQPTRLPSPWDSPGKNTGVGCHFLLQCMKVKSESEVAQSCLTLATPWTAAHQAPLSAGFSRQKYWSGVTLPSPNVAWAFPYIFSLRFYDTLVYKDRRRQWHSTPVLLPGKSHGRGSLVGCRLWGRTESDTTERLHFHFSLSCIEEGNGNLLQCSCLENPRDSGAR